MKTDQQAEYCAQHHLSRKTFARCRTLITSEPGSSLTHPPPTREPVDLDGAILGGMLHGMSSRGMHARPLLAAPRQTYATRENRDADIPAG
jgi:hypothetical protein